MPGASVLHMGGTLGNNTKGQMKVGWMFQVGGGKRASYICSMV